MRSPIFVSQQQEEAVEKPERDIREILKESDDRAHKIFERHDPYRPKALREPQGTSLEDEARND